MSDKQIPKNPNHPQRGASIKVEPIRDLKAIRQIKKLLKDNPRDLCLFTLGINTAYRANELLKMKVDDVAHLKSGDRLDLKQSKNAKYRATTLNRTAAAAIKAWLKAHPNPKPNAPLFPSRKGGEALSVSAFNRLVKKWCQDANLKGNFGTHTLRKTWGYFQRISCGTPVALLMSAYGHSSEKQTLGYLGIQPTEISDLFMGLEL